MRAKAWLGSSAGKRPDVGFPYKTEAPDLGDPTPAGIGNETGSSSPMTSIGRLREIYAEGDVYIKQGKTRVIQATKVYFNVLEDRSLIIGGEIRTNVGSLSLDPANDAQSDRNRNDGDNNGIVQLAA